MTHYLRSACARMITLRIGAWRPSSHILAWLAFPQTSSRRPRPRPSSGRWKMAEHKSRAPSSRRQMFKLQLRPRSGGQQMVKLEPRLSSGGQKRSKLHPRLSCGTRRCSNCAQVQTSLNNRVLGTCFVSWNSNHQLDK